MPVVWRAQGWWLTGKGYCVVIGMMTAGDGREMDEISSALEALGLSTRERDCYLALLKQGSAPANIIAQRAQINRTNAYAALNNLKDIGIVYVTGQKYYKIFHAQVPTVLVEIAEEKSKEAIKVLQETKKIVGLIESMITNKVNFPAIIEFHGVDGLRKAYIYLLESVKNEKIVIGLVPETFDASPLAEIGDWFIEQRMKRGIKLFCMEPSGTLEQVQEDDAKCLRETRNAPEAIIVEYSMIEVSEGVIILAHYQNNDLYTLVVSHKDLSKIVFELLKIVWTICRKD